MYSTLICSCLKVKIGIVLICPPCSKFHLQLGCHNCDIEDDYTEAGLCKLLLNVVEAVVLKQFVRDLVQTVSKQTEFNQTCYFLEGEK